MTTELKIEKGVPIPPAKTKIGLSATLRSMEIGDSIFLQVVGQNRLGGRIARVLGKGNWASRKEGAGCRVWRIK